MKLGETVWAVVDEEGRVAFNNQGPCVGFTKSLAEITAERLRKHGHAEYRAVTAVPVRLVRVEEGGDGTKTAD